MPFHIFLFLDILSCISSQNSNFIHLWKLHQVRIRIVPSAVEFNCEERARAAKKLQLPKRQRSLSGELDQNTHIPHSRWWCNAHTHIKRWALCRKLWTGGVSVCKRILYKSSLARKLPPAPYFDSFQGCCAFFILTLRCVCLQYCTSTLKYCHWKMQHTYAKSCADWIC
jgi:hypothetical protein